MPGCFDGLHAVGDVAVGGEENNLCGGNQLLQFLHHIHSIAVGQKHIAEHYLYFLFLQCVECRGAVFGFQHFITFQLQQA